MHCPYCMGSVSASQESPGDSREADRVEKLGRGHVGAYDLEMSFLVRVSTSLR